MGSWADPRGEALSALSLGAEMVFSLVLVSEHFVPSAQKGPIVMVQVGASSWPGTFPTWRGMLQSEHTGVSSPSFPWGHEVECLMMLPFCSSSGVPIQFQPF